MHPILKLSAVLQEPKLHTIDWCFWNALVSCVALVPLLSHCVSCSTENWFHKLWFCLDRSFIYGTFFFYLLFTVEVTVCDQMHAAAFYLTKKNVFIASHSLPFVPAKGLEIMLHATAVNCTCSCGGHSKIIHPCPVYALS